MSLEEYYWTNYSKCNLTNSFLASWRGLAYPCHTIQVFALPIQIFTFYIIMKHTPVPMKMMKWPLLINYFCCSLFDFLACTMSTPYLFLHNFAFLGVGVFSWMGVNQMFQALTGYAAGLLICSSYIYLFETRSSSLHMNLFKMTRKWVRGLYHALIYSASCTFFPLVFFGPQDQIVAKLASLKIDPCPTREFFDNDIFIVSVDLDLIHFVFRLLAPALLLHVIIHIMFHLICTVYYLFKAPNRSTSQETRKIQQKFFIGIIFQTSIPTTQLSLLALLFIYDSISYNVTQEMMNLGMICLAIHGIVESITILLVHGSYRRAVWNMMQKKKLIKVSDVHRDTFLN